MGNQEKSSKSSSNDFPNKKKQHTIINYSEKYKVMFDGFTRVGKTTLINKYLEGKEVITNEKSYCLRRYNISQFGFLFEGKNIGINLYDCSEYINLEIAQFISRRIDVFIFIYDISDKSTLIYLKKHILALKDKFEEKDALLILVGNKKDLPRREVFEKDINYFIKEFNMTCIETSTVTGEGITQLFELIIDNITKRIMNQFYPIQNQINLSSTSEIPNADEINNTFEKPNNLTTTKGNENNFEKLYNEQKLKNDDLEKQNIKLQALNVEKELKNEREKNSNTSSNNSMNEDIKKLLNLCNNIYLNQKELKEKKKYLFDLDENEKLISIIISSEDKSILYSIICKNTDKFCISM